MATKNNRDFQREYPNGYSKNGNVYDGNNNKIGYQTGDGDYRITDGSANNGNLYRNH